MVDYLSRVKLLTIKLRLPNHSKNESGLNEELRKSCSKLLEDGEKRVSHEIVKIDKVEMRKQIREKNVENIDDDDDVFYDEDDKKETDSRLFKFEKATITNITTPTPKSPLVNKRLAKVKRPLVVTRSVPLSPAAIPDKDKVLEDKLRADMDYLCGEMVSMSTLLTACIYHEFTTRLICLKLI